MLSKAPMVKLNPASNPTSNIQLILFVSLLLASLLHATKIPILNVAVYNVLIPIFSSLLIIINRKYLRRVWKEQKYIIIIWTIIWGWIYYSAILSPVNTQAVKFSTKYLQFYILFLAMLVYVKSQNPSFATFKVIYRFIFILSIVGATEAVFYDWTHNILIYFRGSESLWVYPRIASLMTWPNQFGVLLTISITLALILYKEKYISKVEIIFSVSCMIVLLSLTGSRNAWLMFAISMLALRILKITSVRGNILLVGIFIVSLFTFFVPVNQLGIYNHPVFPFTMHLKTLTKDTAFSSFSYSAKSERIKNKFKSQEQNPRERLTRWKRAFELWLDYPLTGIGFRAYSILWEQDYAEAHQNPDNLFITVLVENGIIGVFLGFLFCFLLFLNYDWSKLIVTIPIIIFFISQILDYFIHDITFMVIFFYIFAYAFNLKTTS